MKNKGAIGDLFHENLVSETAKINNIALERLMKDMGKSNFLSFSVRNFNVYYAAAIFSGFWLSLCLGGHYLKNYTTLNENFDKSKNEIALLRSELNALKSLVSEPMAEKESVTNEAQLVSEKISYTESIPAKSVSKKKTPETQNLLSKTEEKLIVGIDSINIKEAKNGIQPQVDFFEIAIDSQNNIESKEPVYIHVRDTIIQFDTLKVKRWK